MNTNSVINKILGKPIKTDLFSLNKSDEHAILKQYPDGSVVCLCGKQFKNIPQYVEHIREVGDKK